MAAIFILTDTSHQYQDFVFISVADKMQTKDHNFTALTIDLVDMIILVEVKYLLRKKTKTKTKKGSISYS